MKRIIKIFQFSHIYGILRKSQLEFIKNITLHNPIQALKLYQKKHIYNKDYYFLYYYLAKSYDPLAKEFFQKITRQNIRAIFNYFNYNWKHQRDIEPMLILDLYFKAKKLYTVKTYNQTKPLYVNNIHVPNNLKNTIKREKKVSIVMTVYNEEELIAHSIQSLFDQTYINLEVIVVNDASLDGTFDQLLQAKSMYGDRFHIISLDSNQGTYIARNIGISYANGDLITFHDADDWAHPQRIEEHVKAFESSDVKASISKLVRVRPDGFFFSKYIYPLDRLCMVSLMVDRCIIDKLGYFRLNRTGSDTEYYERVKLFSQYKVARIDKVLTFCAYRPNSLTTSSNTGVDGFGENSKRVHYMNRWKQWHKKLLKAKRKPFVGFDRMKYNDIISRVD